MEFSDDSEPAITIGQVELAELSADGVVRAFVALDGGPRLVIDFAWQDLATIGALSNSLLKQGADARAVVTLVLNGICAGDIQRWQRMSYDERALELLAHNLPIV